MASGNGGPEVPAAGGAEGEPAGQELPDNSVFVAKFLTREEMATLTLPYGTLCGSSKGVDASEALRVVSDTRKWSEAVFEDCVEYIRLVNAGTGAFEWYHDFVVFTNLQMAAYNNCDILQEGPDFNLVLDYTVKHVRNLRSSVARNALLFVACIVECTAPNQPIFVNAALRLIPQLFKCATSEKIVYRKPALEHLKAICDNCHDLQCIEIVWVFMDHTKDRNVKIGAAATLGLRTLFDRIDDDELIKIDRAVLADYVERCLTGRNTPAREICSKVVKRLVAKLSPEEIHLWWSGMATKSHMAKLLKPFVSIPIADDDTTGKTDEPSTVVAEVDTGAQVAEYVEVSQ
ncbi:ERAD-associated E3 ubiquitin-protein ligase HRD1, putative [Babesia caballi]|uniref:ERAD-associated E3 ubiquitin-protein ligase HRD1, putative n=1 Tax=Babesia caballi TaxID=5871 RepID=A0AAV4M4E0_BABCB|nr:ERAD-associated E3 ubiquitin-protein ligase HRD1, putative [Babesia caballi]